LTHWDEINGLTKTGRVVKDAPFGAGDAPFRLLNIQADGSLGSKHTGKVSFLPYVHNVDSFGYDTRVIPQGEPYETESWGWLLDPRWAGKVGMVNAPTIGIFDMALAARAHGLIEFDDIGDITRAEVDRLFDIMIDYKSRGHFAGVWNSVPESVDFMRRGRVAIESMFSPAVSTLNGQGIPVSYAAPKEGYRAWHGVMCLSSKTTGHVRDAAYRFMNWWLSGWAGAFIARQGYYISNPERSRDHLARAEWEYWYEGNPALRDLQGPDGRKAVTRGTSRSGGSYENRLRHIAVWNTVMDTYEYTLPRWHEFLTA
ncbi:MAG: extracellular solute-binding protein, partial [Planctomycetota bacterium]